MNLLDITLSKISHTQGNKYCMISLTWVCGVQKSQTQRTELPKAGGWRELENIDQKHKISVRRTKFKRYIAHNGDNSY